MSVTGGQERQCLSKPQKKCRDEIIVSFIISWYAEFINQLYIYILFKNVNWSSFVSGSHKKFQSLVCSSVCCLPWMLRQMPSPSLSAQQPVLYTFRHAWPVLTLSNDRQWGRVFLSSAVYCMSAPFRVYVSWHMLAFLPLARSVQQVNTSTAKLSSGKYAK